MADYFKQIGPLMDRAAHLERCSVIRLLKSHYLLRDYPTMLAAVVAEILKPTGRSVILEPDSME
jgi:hypothetical protein